MSLSSDDTPTGPVDAPTGPITGLATRPAPATPEPMRKQNLVRDLTAAALVVTALFVPWNLYFGFGIPDSKPPLFALLGLVTLLSLLSLAVPYAGPWMLSGAGFNPVAAGRLRLGFNVPYLLFVVAFIGYDGFETIRFGGTVHVPGGIGPGGWLGVAGAVLSAQPVIIRATDGDDRHHRRWLRTARFVGYASLFGAALSSGFNLCWRLRFALRGPGGALAFGTQNVTVAVTAVVYGVVAFVAVLVASRWILKGTQDARLTTLALGASTLVAGIIVWGLPIGREIDAFHGIAQNTSTAGVGYEGYLAWAAAAALFAPLTLFGPAKTRADQDVWAPAMRNGLLLIVVWCLGSVLMRITDLIVAVILNYPFSRYDSMTLAAFDLATAVLAVWLRVNLGNRALGARPIWSLCGLLFTLTVSRVILGIVLAPRFQQSPAVSPSPVYGNNLAQQITSTFDVVLCGLALGIAVAVIVTGRPRRPARPRRPPHDAPTAVLSRPAGSPRIFRSATPAPPPKIFRPPGNPS
ncbi:hypothetical protein BST45_05375 [Mycobacterium shinjukuense]|uniref:DUF7937 domain-containing protein n=2 Tax=Mycobacterium shinjukuense TaxID=398694 RepID=A0A7I7MS34_9MYCO|nr:hypothetical protein BST45_05375 [Mycobacterium shinjukuense]BBX74995.1 hypothetical protein MSHI_29010 [Mycobacterium shinjukuense]